jgi:NAD(P)-dependent dehydrogenase (short-subunit alcohol dehydrogenase family)
MGKVAKAGLWLAVAGGAYLAYRRFRKQPAYTLEDQVVLITGGSRGLGLEMARVFAREGARLAICARDPLELERARQELEERGAEVLALVCDVSREEAVQRMVADVEAHYGRIDVLVNNAGIIQVGPLACMSPRDFEEIMGVIFYGALYTTFAVLPGMRRRGSGRLVNIVSIGGRVAVPHMIPYDAAKFALRGFSEGLRTELAASGITVTTIMPGLMRTGSPVNALFKGKQEWEFSWFAIADSLPLLAMDSQKAAERIVLACRRGEAEVTLTARARLMGLAHDLAPSLTMGALTFANRLLPRPDGAGSQSARGMDLVSPIAPSFLTHWTNEAAKRNNEFGGVHQPDPRHAERIGLCRPPAEEPATVILLADGFLPTHD